MFIETKYRKAQEEHILNPGEDMEIFRSLDKINRLLNDKLGLEGKDAQFKWRK